MNVMPGIDGFGASVGGEAGWRCAAARMAAEMKTLGAGGFWRS